MNKMKVPIAIKPLKIITEVWILVISHKHGVDVDAYENNEIAEISIHEYVQECWGEYYDTLIPKSRQEAIEEYFDDNPGNEWYGIRHQDIVMEEE